MTLIDSLSSDPEFDWIDPRRTPFGLRNTFDFCRNTWEKYWMKLLAPSIANSIRAKGDPDRMEYYAQKDPKLRSDVWPRYDEETFRDTFTRNWTACGMILDKSKQRMMFMGMGPPYDLSDELKKTARTVWNDT